LPAYGPNRRELRGNDAGKRKSKRNEIEFDEGFI
jgi:hypothetical protein